MLFTFGNFRLDVQRRELRCGAARIEVEPKVFDLLTFLLLHRDRVVSKDDLLNSVWSGRIVSESALTTRINAARRALGDNGAAQKFIRTLPRKGFRFIGEVTAIADDPAHGSDASVFKRASGSDPAYADRPSIAVMRFRNMSGEAEQDYFVDGMVEDIITALSRIRWLFVVARDSTFACKAQAIDVRQVGRELDVRYVLEGSVRKDANRVRITAQLVDAVAGTHLWADRFDGSLEDVFELQSKVASSVAGFIEPALQTAETARSAHRPTSDLTAYDLYLRAHALFLTSARRIPEALRLMEHAIARDPRYGPALAEAAICCFRLILDSRSEDVAADRAKGIDFARRALEDNGDDPGVLANAALALAYFGEDIGTMIALVDRALAINPNFARGWHIIGLLRVWAGQPELAIMDLETALRLSPRARIGTSSNLLGLAYLFARRFEDAVPKLLIAIQEDPSFPAPYRFLASCYGHLGRLEDARQIFKRLSELTDVVVPDVSHFRNAAHREVLLSGLRLATKGRNS